MAAFLDSNKLLECPICYETLSSPKLLTCSHFFCKTCIDGLTRRKDSDNIHGVLCPVCKKLTASEDLKDIPIVNQMLVMCDHCNENNPAQANSR